MTTITLDFETRSACDLKQCGAFVYSEHPTTEVICLYFCTRSEKLFRWLPGDPEPEWLRGWLADGGLFECHNISFDRMIWSNIMVAQWGWPEVPPEQWRDTMAVCGRKSIPLDLDAASKLLGLPVVKDTEAQKALHRIMKPITVKRGQEKQFIERDAEPETYQKVYDYCGVDTRAQMHLGRRLGSLEPREQEIWFLNQRMNQRGLALDLEFAADCQAVVDDALAPLAEKFADFTGGCKAGSPKLREHLNAMLPEEQHFPNLKKETVEEALAGDLPDSVRELLEMRSALTSASIKKLKAMRRCVNNDGRARGLLQYHAATTGRDGGRLLQPQNFPRGSVEFGKDLNGDPVPPWEMLIPLIRTRDAAFIGAELAHMEKNISPAYAHLTAPVSAAASALRHCLVAGPGNLLVSGDFSTIEVRVVLALAGQQDKIDLIASGVDPYCDMAEKIFGYAVNKKDNPKERQDGKAAVLGLGFQMGVDKFWRKDFKGRPRELVKRIVDVYRKEWAPEVPKLWYGLQEASTRCVWDRVPVEFNGMEYRIEDEWLTCRLPSGRKLYYFRPRQVKRHMPWSTPEKPDIREGWTYIAKKMGTVRTIQAYGGLLAENCTQAVARDILYDRALVADREGFPLVLTVHDEMVCETPEARADWPTLQQIMEEPPAWAKQLGVPIASEGWVGERYRK